MSAAITITYDDGRLNNYFNALPLHLQYNIGATFSIIAERTITPTYWHRHMQPWQVCDVAQKGIEISSHGYHHKKKFTELNGSSLEKELVQSKEILAGFSKSGKVGSICIPYSSCDDRVFKEAEKHYEIIRVHGRSLNDLISSDKLVCSYSMRNDTSFESVKELIDLAIEKKKWLVLMFHGVVDGPKKAEGIYDVTKYFLEKVLKYIVFNKDLIKYYSFEDVVKLREKEDSKKLHALHNEVSVSLGKGAGSYVLAEDDGYMITYHKNSIRTNKIVISFGGLPSKKTERGFGSSFILKHGYDHIFVAQQEFSQYQKLSLDVFYRVISPFLIDKDVYTYGSSLGGYAAIYYGGIINAKIISAAPKNSAHPSMLKKRFEGVKFKHLDYKDNPVSSRPPVVLFDPYREEEAGFIERFVMPAYPNAVLIKTPFAGHTVLNTMKESGVLSDFIKSYVENDKIKKFELKTNDSWIWNAERGRFLYLEGNYDEAQKHFEASLSIKNNAEASKGLAKVLCRKGNVQKAYNVIDAYKKEVGIMKDIPLALQKKVGVVT